MGRTLALGIVGAGGRMGQAVRGLAEGEMRGRFSVRARIDRENAADFREASGIVDAFVDFSLPVASEGFLKQLLDGPSDVPYVIGCTGWKEDQLATVRRYAGKACVLLVPNFSPGVNLMLQLIEHAAPLMRKWGYGASLREVHHARKVDAPSGTAKAMIERLGTLNPTVKSERTGDVVGIHELKFTGKEEILTLHHETLDRAIFARGALFAAEWAAAHRNNPGLYSMRDVLSA